MNPLIPSHYMKLTVFEKYLRSAFTHATTARGVCAVSTNDAAMVVQIWTEETIFVETRHQLALERMLVSNLMRGSLSNQQSGLM